MHSMARRDRKTGAFLSQPQLEELHTIEDFQHAMAFIQQQDKVDSDGHVAKYQKLARDRDITLPGRINTLVKRDVSSRADIYSTMAPICRAATMSFMVNKRGNKIPDDVVRRSAY
jgi:hypothetical protein